MGRYFFDEDILCAGIGVISFVCIFFKNSVGVYPVTRLNERLKFRTLSYPSDSAMLEIFVVPVTHHTFGPSCTHKIHILPKAAADHFPEQHRKVIGRISHKFGGIVERNGVHVNVDVFTYAVNTVSPTDISITVFSHSRLTSDLRM